MQDTVDIIKTIQNVYENDPVFSVLKDYERVLDELGLYVYDNWEDGELVEGPVIGLFFKRVVKIDLYFFFFLSSALS